MAQLPLFDMSGDERPVSRPAAWPKHINQDFFEGALLLSAIGDALGWPTEFGRYPKNVQEHNGRPYLTDFVSWTKLVGGRYWGYEDFIQAGSYSDDTQMMLMVARCIDEHGRFQPEQFAYFELPLWLHYERGGGRSIKTAARTMVQSKKAWYLNFYRQKEAKRTIDYRTAGANGAAMRVLPISLVNAVNEPELKVSAFQNAIVTHGHPRAILGTLIYAEALAFLLRERQPENLFDYVRSVVHKAYIPETSGIRNWVSEWDRSPANGRFEQLFEKTRNEAVEYIEQIEQPSKITDKECYRILGADRQPFKGSGISTVLVSLYLFAKYLNRPMDGILAAVNALGSDTDTIANFVGGLFGAYWGTSIIPNIWVEHVQDHEYLQKMAEYLYEIATAQPTQQQFGVESFTREEALLRVRAWEIGLHELFWDAIDKGNRLVHPSLGPGIVLDKKVKPIRREGYEAKLIKIQFDCGQSCVFHSRVARDGTVSESLAKELKRGMEDMDSLWE